MSNNTIKSVTAREVLDSRGWPTIEAEITLNDGTKALSMVPSGASTGFYEAHELRDNDKNRYMGRGVLKAVSSVKGEIAKALIGKSVDDQSAIDGLMIDLDGTENKKRLGANAILSVSLAVARARAKSRNREFFEDIAEDYAKDAKILHLPIPLINIINGGEHADNALDIQEFMVAPVCGGSFKESLRAGAEIFQTLKKILSSKGYSVNVGDEGGYAPNFNSTVDALDTIMQAIEKAGYRPGEDVLLALDCAASEYFVNDAGKGSDDSADGVYNMKGEGLSLKASEMVDYLDKLALSYPIASIEDGMSENDTIGWQQLTARIGNKKQLVGDDLFVTNPSRLKQGIKDKTGNAILIKVNQIGTFSETAEAIKIASENNFGIVMSHRSGETEDSSIADLAVGFDCGQIKTGSLSRSERIAKYNRLLKIESILGDRAVFDAKVLKKYCQ